MVSTVEIYLGVIMFYIDQTFPSQVNLRPTFQYNFHQMRMKFDKLFTLLLLLLLRAFLHFKTIKHIFGCVSEN